MLVPCTELLLNSRLTVAVPDVLRLVPNIKPLLVTVLAVNAPAADSGPLELIDVPLI